MDDEVIVNFGTPWQARELRAQLAVMWERCGWGTVPVGNTPVARLWQELLEKAGKEGKP